jgi:Copper binding periplasmic protein CusF
LGVLWLVPLFILSSACQKTSQTTNIARPSPTPQISVNGPPGFPPPVLDKPYPGTGVVAAINLKEGWIEINHEEIKDLMPAMQMEFMVKDKSLLDKVRVGDRVDFTIVETKGGEYLTELKRKA